ncbi:uncharacterized protein LOC124344571 isoform X2 [Daphnia pulicaria]|nr:uncharacterized protein LOC124344571 isoform X2 [Daphnia pulicaria]
MTHVFIFIYLNCQLLVCKLQIPNSVEFTEFCIKLNMENSVKNISKNLKNTEELSNLVSKSLAKVIRFSTNEEMKLSCLKLLNVNNSSEAEKVIQQQLIEWKKQPIGESNIESQLPAQKRKLDSELNKIIANDLENWE